jgi:hypothetical protein
MNRTIAMALQNLALTSGTVLVGVVIGYLLGSLIAAGAEPTAARFVLGRISAIATDSLNNYYAIRNGVIEFSCWAGLAIAQVSFLSSRLTAAPPPAASGAFPVVMPPPPPGGPPPR